MGRVCWHNIRATVPDGWEVTAYSMEDRAGRLEFSTRVGLMATFSYEECPREPDRGTTMVEFLRKNVSKAGVNLSDLHIQEIGPFMFGCLDRDTPAQALAFCPKRKKLMSWVFEANAVRKGKWSEAVSDILKSYDTNDGGKAEYLMYGIHAMLPWPYKIETMVTLPANVMMAFESEDDKRQATFRRWGLPEMFLDTASLAELHERVMRTRPSVLDSITPCKVNGYEGCLSTFNAPREHHADRFMARRWKNGKAVIWHDTDAKRIYSFEQIGPDKSPELDLSETIPGAHIELQR